jgi:ATP-dependent Lhr-like helicase
MVFAMFHPRVRSLIRGVLDWRKLRDIQVRAARQILTARDDVLIIAGTASGKTEAAWFPIFSRILTDATPGVSVLCVSPMKALIDDQLGRLQRYGRHLDLHIEGWHGDVSASRKAKILRTPPAALIITPESLQSLLMSRTRQLERVVAPLRFVVIDEVHAFAGTDRGQQLQSLLHQIEVRLGRRVPRIALSATVSEPDLMTEFLRPGDGDSAVVVRTPTAGLDLDVTVRGMHTRRARVDRQELAGEIPEDAALSASDVASGERLDIARDIDAASRGRRTLVFSGSRSAVEEMATLLRDEAVTGTRRPERFLAHHGSLSPELRRAAESALHQHSDAVVICTSTLELGVDLPHLDQVIQVDACPSVASLRQRLGRSGRTEGVRPRLRIYATEDPTPKPEHLLSNLRAKLLQNIATVELIVIDDWVEPPDLAQLGLSTLVHQTLALLETTAGTTADHAWRLLCHTGPWRRVSASDFASLLRELARRGLLRQDPRGTLLLDEAGQQLVSRRDFLAVFESTAECSIRHKGKMLGTVPARTSLRVGASLVFGGRTWQVVDVHGSGLTVEVIPSPHGLPLSFTGVPSGIHRVVRQKMRSIYEQIDIPDYLNDTAVTFLAEARNAYHATGLGQQPIIPFRDGCLLALWTGDRELATIERWIELRHPGFNATSSAIGLRLAATVDEAQTLVKELLTADEPPPTDLARGVVNKATAKYDRFLPEDLLIQECASRKLDVRFARAALEQLLVEHAADHDQAIFRPVRSVKRRRPAATGR